MSEAKLYKGFPDPLATNKDKEDKAYGLAYGKYIADHWFGGGMTHTNGCSYLERRNWIREKRLYARGKQDPKRYKDHVADELGLPYLNLDFRPTNWMGKFVRVITGGIGEENYTINVSALDRLAGTEREELKNRMNENMRSMPVLREAQELLGIDVTPKGYVPENEDDLKMAMNIKHRPKCEISEELLINYVLKTNNWHNTKEDVDRDLTECGLGIVKVKTDKRNGIIPEYIDPEYFVHSYVRKKDFSDAVYMGHIEKMTLGDLWRNSGLKPFEIREIASSYNGATFGNSFIDNIEECDFNSLLEMKCNVLHFTFETAKTIVYKKKKTPYGEDYIRKDEDYNPPKRNDYGRVDDVYNTWMEGSFIIGTNHIFDYKEVENMITDENDRALPDYVVRASEIYENKLGSFVEDVEATMDEMQYTSLKLQQVISEIRPNGANIDIDLLAELETSQKGKKLSWQHALAIFQAKGIIFSKRVDMGEDGGVKEGAAVTPITNGIPDNLPYLLNVLQNQYDKIRDITGINPFMDGTQNERALVGVQQFAFLQGNLSTKHIVNASLDITKCTAERISARFGEIYSSSQLSEMYTRAVGKENMDVVEALKDRALHEFAFHIQLKPTKEQVDRLREDLKINLEQGLITSSDKMECENLAEINIKTANEFLKYIIEKRTKEQQERDMVMAQNKAQNDAASARAAQEAKVWAKQQESQINVWEYREKKKIDIMNKQQENNVDAPLREENHRYDMEKEYARGNVAMGKTKFIEDEKLRRQNKNNTDHSKMTYQRATDSKPIDFEKPLTFKDMIESLK